MRLLQVRFNLYPEYGNPGSVKNTYYCTTDKELVTILAWDQEQDLRRGISLRPEHPRRALTTDTKRWKVARQKFSRDSFWWGSRREQEEQRVCRLIGVDCLRAVWSFKSRGEN